MACYDRRMGLVRWMGGGAGWLVLLGLTAGCAAADTRPGKPTHPQSAPERARVELPEVEVAGPEALPPTEPHPPSAPQADRSPAPNDKPASICDCRAGDLMCAMRCPKPISSPPPPSSTSKSKPFDRGAASAQMAMATSIARAECPRSGGPVGSTRVTVQFATSGRVTSTSIGSPFTSTETGKCIMAVFRQAVIPPFPGSPVSVSKSVTIEAR